MLSWLKKQVFRLSADNGERSPTTRVKRRIPDGSWIYPHPAEVLLAEAERPRLMQALWENCPLSADMFDVLWLAPLRGLAEQAQALPLMSGTYGRLGGLLDAMLSVSVCAVRLSKSHLLPPGAPPEEQAAQSSAWCTAIYYVALFSLSGELGAYQGEMRTGKSWFPTVSMPSDAYRFRHDATAANGGWRLMMAGRLLPPLALRWLAQWPSVLQTLLSSLAEGATGGIVSVIIDDAWEKCGVSGEKCQILPGVAASSDATIPQHADNYSVEHPVSTKADSEIEKQNTHYNNKPDENLNLTVNTLSGEGLISALPAVGGAEDNEPQDVDAQHNTDIDTLSILDSQLFPVPDDKAPDGRQPGQIFFDWLAENIYSDALSVNEKTGIAHVVSHFLFLKTPECFFRYLSSSHIGLDKSVLQQSFEDCAYHHTRNGKGIYTYRIYDNPDKEGRYEKISGYMIPVNLFPTCKDRLVNSSLFISPNN
ncbi:TraI domain-containing protein [Musicola paradisiaca]|uniref:Uncharacterized protein n=1 Tax=Musicola paradisiaca (strain Ech703) TaxID=579405 RepID=C6CCI0_MUSP7|nr:TraI domain-containing protein [Musicola paradisiaca]ACS86823.1 protein of unknown function DUF1528 [Musicola paradisiaca Ech703]